MRKYLQAYNDVLQSGYIQEERIKRHISQHIIIDEYLPDSASFFYIVQFPAGKYHFLGKQQEHISGYPNSEFMEKGVELFLRCLHPDEIDIVLKDVYQDIMAFIMSQNTDDDRMNLQVQYNYRFKRKNGEFINLLEQIQALELDRKGRITLALGNVIMLQNTEILPLRLSIKQFKTNDLSKTVFNRCYTALHSENIITSREEEILQHLALGKTSKEVARKLFISPHTVDTHRRNLLKKLKCRSVVELTQIAFKNGML